jgi:hypothetical protein
MQLLKRIASLLSIALLLTGCSSMGTGVTIGDKEIKSSEIQKSVDEILEARKKVDTTQMQLVVGAELLRNQAQFVIISNLLDKIAADNKIVVSEAEVSARRADVVAQIGGESSLPNALVGSSLAASNLDAYLRILIISEKLNAAVVSSGIPVEQAGEAVTKIVVANAKKLGIKVNPKYGTWNPDSASIEIGDVTGGAVTPLK